MTNFAEINSKLKAIQAKYLAFAEDEEKEERDTDAKEQARATKKEEKESSDDVKREEKKDKDFSEEIESHIGKSFAKFFSEHAKDHEDRIAKLEANLGNISKGLDDVLELASKKHK